MNNNPFFSNEPQHVVETFFQLKKTVAELEQVRAAQGRVPGYFHREFDINGLPHAQNSFADTAKVTCVEYLAHGQVDEDLPRQVRYGYRPSNGYSESVTYRDNYWTTDGEISYSVEFKASKAGVLKRSAVYSRNGEVVLSNVTHVQLKQGKRFS